MIIKELMERKKKEKELIKKLIKENRYYEISTDYEKRFSYYKAMRFESKMETGKMFSKLLFDLRDFIEYSNLEGKKAIVGTYLTEIESMLKRYLIILICWALVRNQIPMIQNGEIKTIKQITKEYDNNLEDYVSSFNTDTMSTLDIVMNVMNDIRSNTYYGTADESLLSFVHPRLALNENNNIGVCRHMSDKFTTIMNLIDKRFEAKNIAVYIDDNPEKFNFCNIERPISKETLKQLEEMEKNRSDKDKEDELKYKLLGNHQVTLLKSLEDKCYLVVDVTNPSIGVIDKGRIYTFNAETYDMLSYRPISEILVYPDEFTKANKDVIDSLTKKMDIEELEKKYGLEAQNKVLKRIKN